MRKIKNVGDDAALYLVTGGKDGYVGRDGRLPEGRGQPLDAELEPRLTARSRSPRSRSRSV